MDQGSDGSSLKCAEDNLVDEQEEETANMSFAQPKKGIGKTVLFRPVFVDPSPNPHGKKKKISYQPVSLSTLET
jgi:hypothetical protein